MEHPTKTPSPDDFSTVFIDLITNLKSYTSEYKSLTFTVGSLLGFWWLFWFCSHHGVSVPIELNYLPTLLVVMAFSGTYFILTLSFILFLPFCLPILDKSMNDKNKPDFKAWYSKKTFIKYLGAHGLPIIVIHAYFILSDAQNQFGTNFSNSLLIIYSITFICFFISHIPDKEHRLCLCDLIKKTVYRMFYSFIALVPVLFWSLTMLLFLLHGLKISPLKDISSLVGFMLILLSGTSFLIYLNFILVKAGFNVKQELKEKAFRLIFITLILTLVPPVSSFTGGASLSILGLGGGDKTCFQFDVNHLENLPKQVKVSNKSAVLYKHLSVGEKVYVSKTRHTKNAFSIKSSLIVSDFSLSKSNKKECL